MEKIPEQNFHEVSENRRELRKAINELGGEGPIFDKHYKKPLAEANEQASEFKVEDFGGLKGAKETLRKQKAEFEVEAEKDSAYIDYEAILQETPEIEDIQKVMENITDLKDFRMRRMFEILSPQTSLSARKRNEAVLRTVKEEIAVGEKSLAESDPLILRQAELIEYKEDLAKSGHICITPNVERDLEAIGDRMLTGKPMFLHGPTGTGKTSLARFAATHFTGKDPEMVFCNPQTKESNVWGKTGIKPAKGGAIETVEIYGPLAKAMIDGKTVIFDEFTALPKEQMVFIKGVFNAKVGDRINIVGNGIVEIAPGFQMIFTANLKSEKNPERQDLPPEVKREFEQNNLKVKYTKPDEAYDIMLSRLLNRDGSLDMSFYDLNTTLPNLCKVMAEIQESYTNETDKEVARRAGVLDASGKVYSLKDLVMTQGTVEDILKGWSVEKQTGKKERSFAEFLDERFKTTLTFEAYPKEDRVLVAKILASKGFLLTLDPKELDLPEDIFKLNTIKAMRGDEAVEELQKESGAVRHLTLKEVAELDPFHKRAEILKGRAEALMGDEAEVRDPFLTSLNKKMGKLFGKEKKSQISEISADYEHPDGKRETITLDFEAKLQEFISFYQKTNIDLPTDFEDIVRDLWEKNQDKIEQAIEQKGFDELLIIPGNIPLADLAEKMKMESGNYTSGNFTEGGGFAGAISFNTDKPRLILVHKTQNLKDRPELASTLNIKGQDVKLDEALTLEDYLIFQKKYFEETNKHLDEDGWTWLATKSAARLVNSYWDPGAHQLVVRACDLAFQGGSLGVRPACCFY
jgi:DNA polymerase III delta prime subunit